jgi:hypothetical protein
LSRVYPLLSAPQIEKEIVKRYSGCRPGSELDFIDAYLWRRHFTFNVDDVLEHKYARNSFQTLNSINFDDPFQPTPDRSQLQAIHLHGWVGRPHSGFVFSSTEYARNMASMNPWMHTLSEILATESFIIAGTSLNELDLEYYLSHRTTSTPRRGSGPSILIEPDPDPVTISDCKRYGLTLVRGTFGEFLRWLHTTFPSPPTVSDLVIPDSTTLFISTVTQKDKLDFFTDFELVEASDIALPNTPSPFMSGREPDWSDINHHFDIDRRTNSPLFETVNNSLTDPSMPRLILISTDSGTGKTTALRRIAHNLVLSGKTVISIRTLSKINVNVAIRCINGTTVPVVLIADNFADHAEQIKDVIGGLAHRENLVVLGAERSYRNDYVKLALGRLRYIGAGFSPFDQNETEQLIARYRDFGLIVDSGALNNPSSYASKLVGQPVAISVCQILHDFKSVDRILDSLQQASKPADLFAFLCVSLAQYCYSEGVRYSVLQSAVGVSAPLTHVFGRKVPLELAYNVNDPDFVITLQGVLGERLLLKYSKNSQNDLLNVFTGLARALSPHVNRQAIKARSPEARLVGRLFDSDKVVKPLLQNLTGEFYNLTQSSWEWNSRFWEQRALFTGETDLSLGLQYARHAVAIEAHPFALTTLGKLLIVQMERPSADRESSFGEAMECLSSAIQREESRGRISLHPFLTLFTGTVRYIELGCHLSIDQQRLLQSMLLEAPSRFGGDPAVENARARLDELMNGY